MTTTIKTQNTHETTIPFDVRDANTAKQVLLSLTETVANRIRANHAYISVVAVSIVDYELFHSSKQMTLISATAITNQIYEAACRLFDELWDHAPIRQLGVHTSKATHESGYQYSLFDSIDVDKYEKLDNAIDSIRLHFGEDAIMRASFVTPEQKLSHMSGGLDKSRRTGMTKSIS